MRFKIIAGKSLVLICAALLSILAKARGDTVADQIASLEKPSGGRIGLAAVDTATDKRLEYRSGERFPMCSTFKLLAVGAVLQRVDRGLEKLDRFITYSESDILAYSPVTKEYVKDGGMNLGALCEAAIQQSDNTAGNLLLKTLGGPAGVTNFARSLGDQITRLDRSEPELNSVDEGDNRDTTTTAAMCGDIAKLLTGGVLSSSSRAQLEKWLMQSQTGIAMIRAGVPSGWRTGDKTGRCSNRTTNDVAVLFPPDARPVFIAIYSTGLVGSEEQRDALLANVTRIVLETLHPASKMH